ncbi:MAG: hypothetical protein HQ536_05180 [Parcubacteria group bacterium]|nr:hypothetical protein [Parcubacteria group bacterium]
MPEEQTNCTCGANSFTVCGDTLFYGELNKKGELIVRNDKSSQANLIVCNECNEEYKPNSFNKIYNQ